MEFIKKMRNFKKTWSTNKTVQKRKSVAASMAEATKQWVSGASMTPQAKKK